VVTKCILPVAGFGTRFLPVTKAVPKELLPILDKPLVHYSIDEVMSANIFNTIFITNKYKSSIKDYFSRHDYLEDLIRGSTKESKLLELNKIINTFDMSFIDQTSMLGLGHAILQAEDLIEEDLFAVILPDDVCYNDGDSVLSQMLKISNKHQDKCIIAVEEVNNNLIDRYGIVDGTYTDNSKTTLLVQNMVEKPQVGSTKSNLAIIGRYILTQEIFKILKTTPPDNRGEIQITDALLKMAEKGKVIAYKFEGTRIDCGSVNGYLFANNFFSRL